MSSDLRELLYQEEREYLVKGYFRESSDLHIPHDLIALCTRFYDNVYYWKLKGNLYNEFMNSEFTKELYGPTFTIQNIEFQLFSYPNGEYLGEEGYIQLYLKVTRCPPKIRSLHIYFVLYCQQTEHEFRRAKVFTFPLLGTENGEYMHAWAAHCAPLKECELVNMITFGAMVDIIHIQYYNDADHKDYITQIKMNAKCKHKWSINEAVIHKLKSLDFEQFVCSDRFDNGCWGLCCMPNGQRKEQRGNLALGLVLYKLPFGLRHIKVKYTLKCIETNTEWSDVKDYVLNFKWTSWPTELFLTQQLHDYAELNFTVSLEIIQLVSVQNQIIDHKEWAEFGFITHS